jgi:tetratricopeptide (TPR) repeat protein
MYTIFVSLFAGALVGVIIKLSGTIHSIAGAILPAILVAFAAGILVFRRVSTRITPIVEEAQQHMQGRRPEMALKSLRNGLRWTKWHPLLEPQLRTQIGILLYLQKQYDEALPELARGTKQQWESRAYLGALYFKRREEAPMVKAFEEGVKAGEKDEFFWSLYAYCLNAQGKKTEAEAVLRRGLEKLPGNARLQDAIEAVKTNDKLKMQKFGDRWAMFQLEANAVPTGGQDIPKMYRGRASRPGFREKPQRKR